jgi:ATP-binding cassette subfamily B protein
VISLFAGMASDYAIAKLSGQALLDMRTSLFQHIQKLPIGFFNRFRVGDMVSRFSDDMNDIEYVISLYVPLILKASLNAIIGIIILFSLDWRLTVVMLLGSSLYLVGPNLLKNKATIYTRVYKEEQVKFTNDVDEYIKGQKLIRGYHLQEKLFHRFQNQLTRMFHAGFKSRFVNSNLERIPTTALLVLTAIILGYGGYLTFSGDISVGTFIAYQTVFMAVGQSTLNITMLFPAFLESQVSFQRIEEVLMEKPAPNTHQENTILPSLKTAIHFENITFGYSENELVLKNIDLKIPIGKFIAFVGPSGSGKSTVTQLLLRFYEPQEGKITFDGLNINTLTGESLNEKLAIVFQDSFLFNTTIEENFKIVNPLASNEALIAAAKAAEIHQTIINMADGYQTELINEGGNLSGGQRQRLSLARAIFKDSQVLILDEFTSALDPISEASITETIQHIAKDRTIISITHRLSQVVQADEIFVFDNGEIVEHGTHEELLQYNALYKKMWDKQRGFSISQDGFNAEIDIERLSLLPFFNGIEHSVLQEISNMFVTEHFDSDQMIVKEGDPGNTFYLLVRGLVAISKNTSDGDTVHIATLQDGDHFGEIALIKDIPRTANVVALTPCVCLVLSHQIFHHLMERFPQMKEIVEQSLLERTMR